MKDMRIYTVVSLVILFLLTSCGYRNPYVYTGPEKAVYITSWKNRTSELQLENQIYRSLLEWYQNTDSLKIVKWKKDADLILAGEIISIDLPSLSYGANNTTKEVKLKLQIRYIMKDLQTGDILFEESGKIRSEEYTVNSSSSVTADNEEEALKTIIDELSQEIYTKTLTKLQKL